MKGTPSLTEWLALAACWAQVGVGRLGTHRRLTSTASSVLPRQRSYGLVTGILVVIVNAPWIVTIMVGAPVETTLWWFLLGFAAADLVMPASALVVLGTDHQKKRDPAQPHQRDEISRLAAALAGIALLVPTIIIGAASAGLELKLAAPLGLTVGYAAWHLLWAYSRGRTRRADQ